MFRNFQKLPQQLVTTREHFVLHWSVLIPTISNNKRRGIGKVGTRRCTPLVSFFSLYVSGRWENAGDILFKNYVIFQEELLIVVRACACARIFFLERIE